MTNASLLSSVLIADVSPYFLDRGFLWFKKNISKILKMKQTQSFWQNHTLFLETNQTISLSLLLRRLDELGYEKVFRIEEPGEFSHKGNLIEIFPVNMESAIRVEFFGNKIERIEELPIRVENEKRVKEILRKKLKSQKTFSDLVRLKKGDYLVHLDHGIGLFRQKIIIENKEYYQLEYARGDKLYVPLGLERKLSRYVGFLEPKISGLGSRLWQKTKRKVKKETEKLAKELLKIYAKREMTERPPYVAANEIDLYLKTSFPYEETPDQIKAIDEIEKDLKRTKPMDRLVCGDVGFGKTEIALRSMIRAINSGHCAVMICPTTILAQQHFENFKKRLQNLPIKIDLMSRLQSKSSQRNIISNLKKGKIDIIIGTHRLLSKDVAPFLFKEKGGLLIIDDEHKFGVKQKERFKELRAEIDILSLSATPIPRSLYLSLCSLRDISIIKTPPAGRLPVKTYIMPFGKKIIKKAIEQEIKRGGQVYYLHNRIGTIRATQDFLEKLSGKVKIATAHGRMRKDKLMRVMTEFKEGKINLLLATTIIEAGIDFPNVNTIIIDDATKLGLSQSYQIRGRVGRSFKEASAYLLYPPGSLKGKAKERLRILKQAKDLGSGYKIAIKDLEMRGGGNILGKEQSGSINRVGLNLYCQMVSESIEKMKIETN